MTVTFQLGDAGDIQMVAATGTDPNDLVLLVLFLAQFETPPATLSVVSSSILEASGSAVLGLPPPEEPGP